jgi:hypothetical protein
MNNQNTFFDFWQCILLLKSTGRKASNLRELRDVLAEVAEQSIYHHTQEYFVKDIGVEYTNDFAHWAGEFLEERSLAEQLSTIDPFGAGRVADVRAALLATIDAYLTQSPPPRAVWPGDEFCFNEAVAVIFPAQVRVRNLAEFLLAIRYIEPASLYYHFYEARTRLGNGRDDFSEWLEGALGEAELATKIRGIDPFMNSLEEIRVRMIQEVEVELQRDMEAIEP